ncbi:alpha/beta hydrolase [Serinicoccus sp. CUA-874]|uniref:alpha/beta hydrolase n=1 Tax=Serinicoccus sp. CUA-874 TaxID=1517939 RepID=UPI00117B443A|nr:alpha/beta hydrolase [Serinicoccus sp. CUA-874]
MHENPSTCRSHRGAAQVGALALTALGGCSLLAEDDTRITTPGGAVVTARAAEAAAGEQQPRVREILQDLWDQFDLPNSVASEATQTRYSEDGGQASLRFVEGLGMSERTVTAVGHSAGGGIVGFADVYGIDVDRTLLVAPSGSGLGLHRPLPWPLDPWGAQPSTPDEYPPQTWDGHDRDVQRFTQTAPGDSIAVAQASEDVRWWVGLPEDWGHGDNPNSSDQFIRLETGRWTEGADAGQRLEGRESHRHVVKPGTVAWANTVGIITGGDVIPYREDGDWIGPDNVYDDPDYPGTHPVPIDDLESPWEQSQPEIMAPGPLDGSFGQGGEPA